MKIKFSQNLLDIFNFIESKNEIVSFSEVLHFALDYESYQDLYLNLNIIMPLLEEHNKKDFTALELVDEDIK